MKNLLITEEEKTRILKLYKSIKSALNEEAPNLEPIVVPVYFDSGCHSNVGFGDKCKPGQVTNAFSSYIQKIKDFIKKSPKNKVVQVFLEASESKVPNRDAENASKPSLAKKELSKKRYATVVKYLTDEFTKMYNQKLISKMPIFTKTDILIGGPEWKAGVDPDLKDFKDHQYLKATIKLITDTDAQVANLTGDIPKVQCLTGAMIEYSYDAVVEAFEGHCCDRGDFNIFANGVQLKRTDGLDFASINNSPSPSGSRNLQKDSRPQTIALGYRKVNSGKGDMCYSDQNKNNTVKVGNEIRDKFNTTRESKPGMYRYNTFVISPEQANSIVKSTGGKPGFLTISASPTGENTDPHKEAVRVTIYGPKRNLIYDSCAGGNCVGGAFGPWKVNFCSNQNPVAK